MIEAVKMGEDFGEVVVIADSLVLAFAPVGLFCPPALAQELSYPMLHIDLTDLDLGISFLDGRT
jgi:hypothetical protein